MARPQSIRDGIPRFWRVFRYFVPSIRREKGLVVGSMMALFAGIGFRLLEPWPLKYVLDEVILSDHPTEIGRISSVEGTSPFLILTAAAVAVVLLTGFRAISDYFKTIGFAHLGNRVMANVRAQLYQHLQTLSLSFHNKARTGDLMVRVVGDIKLLRDVAVSALLPLFASALILVGMITVMFWLNWRLTLLSLSILPLFLLSTVRLTGRIHAAARKQRRREGDMAATASESISAVHVVQALSLQHVFNSDFAVQNKKSLKEGVKTRRLAAKLERTVDILVAVATAAVLWYGGLLTLRGELTAGELVVFLTYLKRGLRPLQDFAKYTGRLAKATAAGERVVEIFERTPEVQDLPNAVAAPILAGEVAFENVSFSYDGHKRALDGVSLSLTAGTRVAIVGPSGSGKSTLLALLLRLYDPAAGAVRIDESDIRRFTMQSVRGQMSVVLQDTVLFATDVWENIAFGASDVSREQIEAAARLAGAAEFIDALPDRYETVLGERGVNLSHGQRQRIAIARAAVRDAPLILLDEPLSGLDEQNEQVVRAGLARLVEGKTSILVTHELADAADTDLIIYLENGRIVEQGSHAQLLALGGRYSQQLQIQCAAAASVLGDGIDGDITNPRHAVHAG